VNSAATQAALQRGVAYVASMQQKDGGFVGFSSPTMSPFKKAKPYQTTFVPALILQALQALSTPESHAVSEKLSGFLAAQRSPHWSFNYWAVGAPERSSLPYPDDLDDTFCALAALHTYDPTLLDATALAHVVRLLMGTEVAIGGPYRTWLVRADSPAVWRDVDVAVNANVAYFLKRIGSPLPRLADFLYQAVITGQLSSPYYPSPYPVAYYIARAYSGSASKRLEQIVLEGQVDGHWGTPLQTALAVSALRNLNPDLNLQRAQAFLLSTQRANGSWRAEAFCIDPHQNNTTHYHGAEVLTTALVLEALAIMAAMPPAPTRHRRSSLNPRAQRLHKAVLHTVKSELSRLNGDLRHQSLHFMNRLVEHDTNHEIVLLPYFFIQSLPRQPTLKHTQLLSLCAANLYGWVAYTIYDDFLDDEGQPVLLSTANVALRGSLAHFRRAMPQPAFQQIVAQTFDAIDAANTWEVTHCRLKKSNGTITLGSLPSYARRMQLAERSLGHTLTPLAILIAGGESPQSRASRGLERALRQYLIARQISDDLHDWEQDFRAGHVSFVVAAILRDLRIQSGDYAVDKLVNRMQKKFWNKTLPALCDVVMEHVAASRAQIPPLLVADNILIKLLAGIEASMQRTMTEQQQAQNFLEAFAEEQN